MLDAFIEMVLFENTHKTITLVNNNDSYYLYRLEASVNVEETYEHCYQCLTPQRMKNK